MRAPEDSTHEQAGRGGRLQRVGTEARAFQFFRALDGQDVG